jgi:CRP-like cAMP-binding protein
MSQPSTEELLFERFGRTFKPGEVLFREGELAEVMYVIQSGRIRITRMVNGRESILAELPAGEFFGEMAIVNNRPRSATATVIEEAKLLTIDARTFEAMIRGSVEIAVRMLKKMAERLDRANQTIEMLLLREPNHKVVSYLRTLAETSGVPSPYGIIVQTNVATIAAGVDLSTDQVCTVLDRLSRSRLVEGIDGGFMLPEVGRLDEFLEFLELRERYGER